MILKNKYYPFFNSIECLFHYNNVPEYFVIKGCSTNIETYKLVVPRPIKLPNTFTSASQQI